jgi:hypothetical protein
MYGDGCCADSKDDESPKDRPVHYARVDLSQDADVAKSVLDKSHDTGAWCLQALLALAELEDLETAVDPPAKDYYGKRHHGVHNSAVSGVHGCVSGWYQIRISFPGTSYSE